MHDADPRSRLVTLAAERGTSLAALSALIGRNPTYLQQFVRKGSPRKLEEGDRRTLARFFGIAEKELGGMEDKSSASGSKREASVWIDVPRLALDASAGPGALAGREQAFGHMRYRRQWLRGQGLDPAWLSTIAVSGDRWSRCCMMATKFLSISARTAGATGCMCCGWATRCWSRS
jgi:hypothetical protein